jgi:hypothetical protein
LIEVAGTIARDMRFPARIHDESDAQDEQCARAIIAKNAGWADDAARLSACPAFGTDA